MADYRGRTAVGHLVGSSFSRVPSFSPLTEIIGIGHDTAAKTLATKVEWKWKNNVVVARYYYILLFRD